MMEHDEQGIKPVMEDGYVDVTLPNSPSSDYYSGSESHSPNILSPTSSSAAIVQDQHLNTHNVMPGSNFGDDMDFDIFSLPMVTREHNSPRMTGNQSVASSNYIIPSKVNGSATMSGVSSGKRPVKITDPFDSDIEMVDVEESTSSIGNDKSITLTLSASDHQPGQDLNTLLVKALKTLVPVQNHGMAQNIEISIESSNTASNVRSTQKSNIQLGQISPNTTNNSGCSDAKDLNNMAASIDPFGSTSTGYMLETSPGTGDNTMDLSDIKFPEGSLNQKINEQMGPFDLIPDSDFTSSPSLYDILNVTDTNNIGGDLADQLLNDVSLGTTVDTVPSFSSTNTSPNMQYTNIMSKPSIMSTSPRSISSNGKSQNKFQGSHVSCSKTLSGGQNIRDVTTASQRHITTNKLVQHTNGTNTATMKFNNHKIDSEAAKRSLVDHSYTAQPSRSNHGRLRFSTQSDKKRSRPEGTLLEHFLTTDKPLNPMRGSDGIAQSIPSQQNILKKLLTTPTDGRSNSDSSSKISPVASRTSMGSVGRSSPPAVTGSVTAVAGAGCSNSVSGGAGALPQTTDTLPPNVFDESAVNDLTNILDSGRELDESVWNDVSKQDMDEVS